MKTCLTTLSALGLGMMGACAQGQDTIGGIPRADFATDELIIPCVKVENFDGRQNEMFFDVILERRGNSFNYELILAEPEDATFCQRLADFARFEDDDLVGDDDAGSAGRILLQCEFRSDRSRISVDGRNLAAGGYFATVTSGEVTVESAAMTAIDDEVEFDFDSDPDDVLEGATEIEADFIQDGSVTAEIVDEDTGESVLTASADCLEK